MKGSARRRRPNEPWRPAAAVAFVVAALVVGSVARAQQTPVEANETAGVHPPTDRTLARGIARARTRLQEGDAMPAFQFLDDVLGRPDDYFVDDPAGEGLIGLKEAARRLLAGLPSPQRTAYRDAFGPQGARQLEAALAAGDSAAIAQVAQRYFLTPAGAEAALITGRSEADAGNWLAAGQWFDQVLAAPAGDAIDPGVAMQAAAVWLRAGDDSRAADLLAAAVARSPSGSLQGGERNWAWGDADQLLAQLKADMGQAADPATVEQDTLFAGGNPRRNAVTSGGLPHRRVRWQVRLLGPPRLETAFDDVAADRLDAGTLTPAAGTTIAVGDVVLTATPDGLLAVDFRTGKMIWRTEPQREPLIERLLAPASDSDAMLQIEPLRAFAKRIWEDSLFGSVSSDGRCAFVLRDLETPAENEWGVFQGNLWGRAGAEFAATNRLSAYELATQGKLAWQIDGAAKGPLSGAFFLGPPLPVGETLYALVEAKNRVSLAALRPQDGGQIWQQQLVDLETPIAADSRRRLAATSPSFDGGLVVCPTGAGIVVAVDAVRRSLAWAYQYRSEAVAVAGYGDFAPQRDPSNRWQDGGALLAAGRVLLTPAESDEIHCLDLRSGRLLWKRARGEMQRLNCVHGETVLLSGARRLTALRLADGEPAWRRLTLPLDDDDLVAGSGFLSGDTYFLPLASGAVIGVDVERGEIVARTPPAPGRPLGNLLCHRGSVLSFSGRLLDCYEQVDRMRAAAEAQLATDPQHPGALRTMGELALAEGRVSEALELLHRAYLRQPDNYSLRTVLSECLETALREDFAAFKRWLPLLGELDESDPAAVRLLRIEAQGLAASGEVLPAVDVCLAMFRRAVGEDERLQISADWETTVGRWVQAQLLELWEAADDVQRRELADRIVKAVSGEDGATPEGDKLARAMAFFGDLSPLESWKVARAKELARLGEAGRAEQLWLDLAQASDDAVRRQAQAALAGIGASANLSTASAGDWPTGRVVVAAEPRGGAADPRLRIPVQSLRWEDTDETLGRCTPFVAPSTGELYLVDGVGREIFSASLHNAGDGPARQAGGAYAASRGSFLVASFGRRVVAASLADPARGELASTLAWQAQLGSRLELDRPYYRESIEVDATRPTGFGAARSSVNGRWLGVIGPLTSRGCILQDQRRLICVDLFAGTVAWTRGGVTPGCDLFGDGEYVLAAPPQSQVAQVFRTVDGRYVGEVSVPLWREQLATLGRRILRWRRLGTGPQELALVDAVASRTDWQREFAVGSRACVAQNRYVAVVEPTGRAVVVDGWDGRVLADFAFRPAGPVDEVHLAVGSDFFTLTAGRQGVSGGPRIVTPLTKADGVVLDGQTIVLDRATGEPRWRRAADVVQQSLLVAQPVDLPFLAFAGTLHVHDQRGSRPRTTTLLLDKQTGRTLFQSDALPQAGAAHCLAKVSDPSKREATLELAGYGVTVKFTDQGRPPEPPPLADVEGAAAKPNRGVMGIFLNLGGARP